VKEGVAANSVVITGHSRSKNGVASLAYDPAIHLFRKMVFEERWIAGSSPAMTQGALHALQTDRSTA
jgi:hypothetical protein